MTRQRHVKRRKQTFQRKAGSDRNRKPASGPLSLQSTPDGRLVLRTESRAGFTLAPIPSALIGLGLFSVLAPVAEAADTVTGVSPLNASHSAAITTDVSATLSDVETSGLSAQTFVVHGSQSARSGTNTTSGAGTAAITVNPFNDFHPGERVQATVTAGVQTSQGGVTPHVWRFRTAASGGSGVFSQSSNSLGSSQSLGVSLGDVDGDGDLDAVVANRNQANRVWLNAGSGTFKNGRTSRRGTV